MRAAAYIRVSTTGQAEEGHSLDAQLQDIRTYAEARGWPLVEVYRDEGLSGSLSDRPGLSRLLKDADAGLFDVVIVHKVDRFFRDLAGFLNALRQLNDAGVGFLSVRENIDFTSAWGKLALVILATIAEIFLDILKEETSKGKRQRVREGLWNGSIPTGYCLGLCANCTDPNGPGYCPYVGRENVGDGQNLVLHPIDSVAIAKMFEWYATGDYSDADIADALNHYEFELPDGNTVIFRTRGRGHGSKYPPGPYGKDTVRSILQRKFYTGVVTYKGDEMPGNHPPIIDLELYDKVQAMRKLRGRNSRQRRGGKPTRVFPLTGILRCDECGGRMRGLSANGGVRYYACVNRLQKKTPCQQPMVRADDIEAQVAELIIAMPGDREDWREDVLAHAFPDENLLAAEEQAASLHARYDRLVELYVSGKIDREQFNQQEADYRRELALLTAGKKRDMLETVQLVLDFPDLWDNADPLQKKELLQRIFATVHVKGKKIEGVQPVKSFYALFEYCCYGSDGNRTRDLRLDRPTC